MHEHGIAIHLFRFLKISFFIVSELSATDLAHIFLDPHLSVFITVPLTSLFFPDFLIKRSVSTLPKLHPFSQFCFFLNSYHYQKLYMCVCNIFSISFSLLYIKFSQGSFCLNLTVYGRLSYT